MRKSLLIAKLLLGMLLVCLAATPTQANEPEFDALTKHIKQNYQGHQVKIPFLGLARFAVKIIRPAGVKSFKVAIFENLRPRDAAHAPAMSLVMRTNLPDDWQPLLRVRSVEGGEVYVYAKPVGKDIKLLIASINGAEGFVARVKFSPKSLAKWLQKPEIMGISLK